MISRIAIFRALYLGDMLCIIPTVRAVRRAYPEAEIYLIGLPWQKEFVRRFTSYFDHFVEFPGWPGLPEQSFDAEKTIAFLQTISALRFDLVLQMQGNGITTNVLCALWQGEITCGLRRGGEYCPDEQLFPVSDDDEHEILRFLKLTAALGIPEQGTYLEFPIFENEKSTFSRIAEVSGIRPHKYVCVHPGARDPRRRWPIESFAFVANQITALGLTIVLTGSKEEKDLLARLEERLDGHTVNIVETFGHLSAGELACVLKNARLLISNDTGVSHIASALDVSSVIIFSPHSDIRRWRPLNETLHTAIFHDQARDPGHVLQCAMDRLGVRREHQM